MWKIVLLIVLGFGYGVLAAAGVFTVLVAVGLIPRFAGKTHTASHAWTYENMVVYGTIVGSFLSVFDRYCQFGAWWQERFPEHVRLFQHIGVGVQIFYGLFSGLFIGCLALAIAEMLDSIPIMTRRIGFRHGIGIAIASMAAGKLAGSLLYFLLGLESTNM